MKKIENFLEYYNNIPWGRWDTINRQENFNILYFNTNYTKRLKRLIKDLISKYDFEIIDVSKKDFECVFLIKNNKNERIFRLYFKDARKKELINIIMIETTFISEITDLKNLVLELNKINEM